MVIDGKSGQQSQKPQPGQDQMGQKKNRQGLGGTTDVEPDNDDDMTREQD